MLECNARMAWILVPGTFLEISGFRTSKVGGKVLRTLLAGFVRLSVPRRHYSTDGISMYGCLVEGSRDAGDVRLRRPAICLMKVERRHRRPDVVGDFAHTEAIKRLYLFTWCPPCVSQKARM